MTIFSIFLLALLVNPVHAQEIAALDTTSIASSPRHPEPGDEVTLSLQAYARNTNASTISWFVDGVEQMEAKNSRVLTLTAGALGTEQIITAQISEPDGSKIAVNYRLQPVRLDIVVEADTLTPAFYDRRALPSVGSLVRAVALTYEGIAQSPQSYSYRWQLNNDVLYGGPVRGQHIAEFTMPTKRDSVLSVDVIDETGQTIASEALFLPNVEPFILFYPDNPLRGISRNETGENYILVSKEIDIRAEPYFLARDIFDIDPLLRWRIDNQTIQNPNSDQQTITLQNAGGSGRFRVEFELRNKTRLTQGAENYFVLQF